MNIVFLVYFTVITSLAAFKKYIWSIIISIPAVIHIYWLCSKPYSLISPVRGSVFSIIIYSLGIYFIYLYQHTLQNDLENIRISYHKKQDKTKQLSIQEESLREKNKALEHSLGETATIYEYVKKLGSTLDFNEAVIVLQNTLRALTNFSTGKLILVENNSMSKFFNICSDNKKDKENKFAEMKNHETKLLHKLIKHPNTISYEQSKKSPLGQLPSDINTLLAVPLLTEKQLVSILILENLPLHHLDKIQFIAMQFALEVQKTQLYQKVKELSIIDNLTGLYLRRHFQNLLLNERDRCYRQKQPLSFLMMDIDFFKRYNDEYGHLVGDLILKTIGSILKNKSREVDLLCRYGGDEFALALPLTGSNEAHLVGERLRRGVNEHLFQATKEKFQVSISIGASTYLPQDMHDHSDITTKLIDTADKAMYQAKSRGRNRVVVALS